MFATALRRQRRSVPQVLLCMLLATACDEIGSVQGPIPSAPTRLPESSRYHVSGIVMDAAQAAPIANATVALRHAEGHLTAQRVPMAPTNSRSRRLGPLYCQVKRSLRTSWVCLSSATVRIGAMSSAVAGRPSSCFPGGRRTSSGMCACVRCARWQLVS